MVAATAAGAADPISQSYDATIEANRAARESQRKIDQLDDQTRAALEKYRGVLWQTQQQDVYARQLEQIAATQIAEKASLEKQLAGLDVTEREILPLMLRMLDSLEQFVAVDQPFLQAERRERIAGLRRLMADPGASLAERYRRLLEAYQIEMDYGRSLGAERAELPLSGTAKIVDVLRVGRGMLFYLSLDGEDVGYWDVSGKSWLPLDRGYRAAVRKGLKIAREQAAPELLVLPMPVAGEGTRIGDDSMSSPAAPNARPGMAGQGAPEATTSRQGGQG
ncbi:MAG: DUF3450 domain-containing protein [Gammaproteobacteria bacterium]|nr:DUF3450 domain-containing protein [Gammaproteobacteria bacterium]